MIGILIDNRVFSQAENEQESNHQKQSRQNSVLHGKDGSLFQIKAKHIHQKAVDSLQCLIPYSYQNVTTAFPPFQFAMFPNGRPLPT
jgi:hypothetical protein